VAYSVSGGGQSIVFSEAPLSNHSLYIIYLGKQLTTPRAAGQETTKQSLTGDGVTTLFTLTDPPVVPAGIMVFVDGILQREGAGNNYVSGGSTINFNGAPDSGAEIDVYTLVKEKVSIDTVADGSITRAKMASTFPYWDAQGNFGIGVASPSGILDIQKDQDGQTLAYLRNASTGTSARTRMIFSGDASAGNLSIGMHNSNNSGAPNQAWIWSSGASSPLILGTVGTERVRIDTSGRVLIGTPAHTVSSSEKFEVYNGMSLLDFNSDSVAPLYVKNRSTTAATIQPYLFLSDSSGNRGGFGIKTSDASTHQYAQGGFNWYVGSTGFTGQVMALDSTGAVTINGASVSTADSKLNTQITSAGSLITLAEFRNTDYTAGTKSFLRVRGQVNAGGSYSSYFGQGQDGRTYIIANNSARGGDIAISGDDGTVFMGASVSRVDAGLIVNSGITSGMHIRSKNTNSFYNGTVGNTRNITIAGMGTTGEYYAKVILVGLSQYAGAGYYTRIVEFCGFGSEGRVSVISNTATGGAAPGAAPTVVVTATTTTVNLAVTHSANYRCVAYLECHQGLDMYFSAISGVDA
jgi:hypothetical protein